MKTATKEKPIPFSTEMVRAILNGRKSMTRRVVRPQPEFEGELPLFFEDGWLKFCAIEAPDANPYEPVCDRCVVAGYVCRLPYQPGDVLYVKESYALVDGVTAYRADGELEGVKWKSGRFMPRRFARLFLRVTDVRVERVQEITTPDCIAEGIPSRGMDSSGPNIASAIIYIEDFARIWDRLNAKRGFGWQANPWVWVYTFERVERGEE